MSDKKKKKIEKPLSLDYRGVKKHCFFFSLSLNLMEQVEKC